MNIPSLFPEFFAYELVAPFFLRVILGLIFLGNGYSKLFKSRQGTTEFFSSIGLRPATAWVYAIGAAELASGLMFILGIFVQLAAVIVSLIMVGAIFKVKIKEKFIGGYDFELLILFVSISLLFLGPGIFSFDMPL